MPDGTTAEAAAAREATRAVAWQLVKGDEIGGVTAWSSVEDISDLLRDTYTDANEWLGGDR